MRSTYTTAAGDMWDTVAFKVFGNEMYKNILLEANVTCREIVIFPAGITLAIPEIRLEVSEDLPPWKRGTVNEQ